MTGVNFSSPDPEAEAPDAEEAASLPLIPGVGGGDDGGGDLGFDASLVDASSKSKVAASALPILVIAVVSAAAIFFMRSASGDAGRETVAAEVRAKIDQAVAKISNEGAMSASDPLRPDNIDALFQDTESVVAMFATDYTKNQVPVEFVKKNPFALERPEGEEVAPEADDLRRRYERWLADVRREVQQVRLDAVMGGASPMAIVDGQPIHVGDRLGTFEVQSIEGQTMRLRAVYEPTGKSVVVNLRMPG